MTNTKEFFFIGASAMVLSLLVIALPRTASAYSAAGDFSSASNPNGTWSYGSSTSLASAFIPYSLSTNNYQNLGPDGWLAASGGVPYLLHNGTIHNITNANSVYQPGQIALQPGPSGEYSIVRWTAPSSVTISINATFSGLSSLGDSADVHILLDGVSIFNSTVFGTPAPAIFSGSRSVLAGDTIDFAVGFGDGNPNEDNTALSATIVPEPGTLALAAIGLVGLISFRFLKRK